MNTTLLFVYNADSGLMNGMFDLFHKMMKPSTYKCDLCMITHGYSGMRKAWKSYLQSLPFEKDYLHRNEFYSQYPNLNQLGLPSILINNNGQLEEIVTADELKEMDLVELTKLLKNRLISCRLNNSRNT